MHRLRCPILHLPRDEEPRLPLGEGCNGLPPALAHDGVTLPVPKPLPSFNALRSCINHATVGDRDLLEFLLPPALLPEEEVLPEFPMTPDPGVDRLGTDVQRPPFQVPPLRDLIGAPAFPQLPEYEGVEQ